MRIEPGLRIDEFTRGGAAYFLTHFHADHTEGLSDAWNNGPIYCSALTARLLNERFGLDGVVHAIEPGESVKVAVNGIRVGVTALDANHCPGALMFHFDVAGRRALYSGDFRINDAIRAAAGKLRGVDVAFVDSTYDDPRYEFPPQEEAIRAVVKLVGEHMDKEVFLAVYQIGKTKLLRAVSDEFSRPVYVSDGVAKLYDAMGFGDLVTRDKSATNLRGYARGYYFEYFPFRHRRFRPTHTVIIPTGWAVEESGRCPHGYFYIPYSEHCSFSELQEFKSLLAPKKIVEI
jgi:Cft2 family RNA processing exonuclease